MKSLLLLEVGPKDFKEEYLKRVLDEPGVDTSILINERDPEWAGNYHWQDPLLKERGKDPASRVLRADFRDMEEVLQKIERQRVVVGKPFDGATTYMEEAVETTCKIQTALIDSGLPIPQITLSKDPEVLRSKFKFRKACEEEGLPQPKYDKFTTLEEATNFALSLLDSGNHCCVIKPDKMFYSKGVTKIERDKKEEDGEVVTKSREQLKQEIASAFTKAQTDDFHDDDPLRERFGISNAVLVESYIEAAEELSVEGIVYEGQFIMSTPTAKFFGPEPTFDETGYIIPRPENYNPNLKDNSPGFGIDVIQNVVDTVQRGVKAMKLQNSLIHAECRIQKDGTVVPVDFGARAAGGEIVYFLDKASGVNLMSQMVKLAVGVPPDDVRVGGREVKYHGFIAITDRKAYQNARLAESYMKEEFPAFEGIREHPNEKDSFGFIELAEDSPDEVRRAYRSILKILNAGK